MIGRCSRPCHFRLFGNIIIVMIIIIIMVLAIIIIIIIIIIILVTIIKGTRYSHSHILRTPFSCTVSLHRSSLPSHD